VEYGWVELGDPVPLRAGAYRVRNFYEKPSRQFAALLIRGAFIETASSLEHIVSGTHLSRLDRC
jgi:hypothetical protein